MSDFFFWLADNVDVWRPFVLAVIASFVIGMIALAVQSMEEPK